MLFHLFYNVFFPQQGIVLQNVKEEIFPKSGAMIGWLGLIREWVGEREKAVICHPGDPVLDKEGLCNASRPHL